MNRTRRALLGAAIALPAALTAPAAPAKPAAPSESRAPQRSRGYHVTEHIRTYYRVATRL
jgi:hypothetical protein